MMLYMESYIMMLYMESQKKCLLSFLYKMSKVGNTEFLYVKPIEDYLEGFL